MTVALGPGLLGDLAVLREGPWRCSGRSPSRSTVSRLVGVLAGDVDAAVAAINAVRAAPRSHRVVTEALAQLPRHRPAGGRDGRSASAAAGPTSCSAG